MRYRSFRNFDPPALTAVWNESLTRRGAVEMRTSAPFESLVLDKPYFDPHGLLIAEDDDGKMAGFAHAGFGPTDDFSALRRDVGVVSMIAVRPAHRRQGVGSELLRRAEDYLRGRGSNAVHAGGQRPAKPFYLGLYGGSDGPGFLLTDDEVHPFLAKNGYAPFQKMFVFNRRVDEPLTIVDPRFKGLSKKYDAVAAPEAVLGSWWWESVFGPLEPSEFQLNDRQTGETVARALFWEMKDYGWRWGAPAAGIVDVKVRGEFRRQGVGRYMLNQLLRHLADQYFGIVEVQVPEKEETGIKMFTALGFTPVDTGVSYVKELSDTVTR